MKNCFITKYFYLKIIVSLIILFCIIIGYFNFCLSKADEGKLLLDEGRYYKAADIFYREIRIKKFFYNISKIFRFKNSNALYLQINDLLLETAFCYFENGDIKRALNLYYDLYNNLMNNSYDEAFCNFVKLQISICYSSLGYYNKALPLLQELKDWYPQNLIAFYINTKDFYNAKNILFSEDVQNKINDGEDVDASSLIYLLGRYYLETGQYDKSLSVFSKELPDFEVDLILKLHSADLYFKTNN